MKYTESGTGYSHTVGYEYDSLNNLTELVEDINGTERTTTYTYDDDNRIATSTTANITVEYDYDNFGRIETQTTKNGDTVILTESYTYKAPTSTTTSAQIATYTTAVPNGYSITYTYTYDDNGNITSISDGTNTTSYEYDSANQLLRENNQAGDYTYIWTYDDAGNILSKEHYEYCSSEQVDTYFEDSYTYTYGDSEWGDLLTAYDDDTITYDQIGNPLDDLNWTYTWEHGRQLSSMSDGRTTWTYTYDANGMRTQRTNGTTTYKYYYNGSQLSRMTIGNYVTLDFTYDANGTPLTITRNGEVYYYVTNLQGDVVGILNDSGTLVADYVYDAWGNFQSNGSDDIDRDNPLTYRGYVYDPETGLYYLQSRYYNPEIGRFINADGYISTGQGMLSNNMFVYCLNNPVMMFDTTGEIGVIPILLGVVGLAMILITPSSQRQQATPEQIDDAHKTASRAELTIRNDDSGEPSTIDIQIDTKDVIDSVDSIARNYYYEELYDRTIEKANEIGMSTDNLMSIAHISWEFSLHEIAYHLGIDNAIITDLNVEETPWSMIERAIGWD